MKNLKPLDFYLLRIPSFPLEKLLEVNRISEFVDSEKRRKELQKYFSEENFKKAIYLSSIQLYNTLEEWLKYNNLDNKKEEKLIKTLHKYYIRICTRATPYGLFAGFAFGDISNNKSAIDINEKASNIHCRTDMGFAEFLKRHIVNLDEKQNEKSYLTTNNTLYLINQRIRYISYDIINNQIKYKLSEVSNSDLLEAIVKKAENGISYNELLFFLEDRVINTKGDILKKYIDDLITSKILINNLSPKVTNRQDPLLQLKGKLETPNSKKIILPLEKFIKEQNNKNSLDIKKLQSLNNFYRTETGNKFNQIIQVDLEYNTRTNNLNNTFIKEIISNCEILRNLEKRKTPTDLIDFRNKFLKKFGNQEVPLTVAMDFSMGIGYGVQKDGNIEDTPLLDNVDYSVGNTQVEKGLNPNKFKLIQEKLNDFNQNDLDIIELTRDDIKKLSFDKVNTEDNISDYYLMGKILSKSFSDIDNGKYKFLPSGEIPTPHMPNLLSRFAANNKHLESKIRSHTESNLANSSTDVIFAEIIHQPDERIGNILIRPSFYSYEIPYVSQSSLNDDKEIKVSDILVCVVDNRIILISKSLKKEIIPKLSSAHNFAIEGLPTFRFLCDLQYQKVNTGFLWDWDIFSELDFLPRIEYNKIILSPAQWKLNKDPAINITSIRNILEYKKVSRYCYFASGDNELVLDIQNSLCLTHMIDRLKKGDVRLYEYLCLPDSIPLKDNDSHYSPEIILPIRRDIIGPYRNESLERSMNHSSKIKRNYYPGEEWIYFKIYTSSLISDEILITILKEFSEKKLNSQEISKWFFLRYNDPENHLRVRFKLLNPKSLTIISEMTKELSSMTEDGLINKIVVDTYEREIERYGGESIEESEFIFFQDSVAVVNSLELIKAYRDENIRWKIALISIDLLLNDFSFSLKQKQNLLEEMSNNFFSEFIDSNKASFSRKKLKFSLDQKYRLNSKFLEDVIFKEKQEDDIGIFLKPFYKRSIETEKKIEKLMKDNSEGKIRDLIYSYIHMSMNRFFNSKPRVHELIIYYFLNKNYTSSLKRKYKYYEENK